MERGAADPAGETDGPSRAAFITAGAGTAATTRFRAKASRCFTFRPLYTFANP